MRTATDACLPAPERISDMKRSYPKRTAFRVVVLFVSALSFACQSQKAPQQPEPGEPAATATAQGDVATPMADEYATLPEHQREAPPAATPSPPWSFPEISDSKLNTGLAIKVVQRRTLPLVDITLVVRSGQATDGTKPGLAVLAGEMLKVGGTDKWASRQLLDRVESLGSSLEVVTSRDSTTLSMAVTSDKFDEALDLMGLIVSKPQFADDEYRKLKRREMDRVSSLAKTNARWAASMVLYQHLYQLDKGTHPYSEYDATSEQIEKIGLWEVKQWYRTYFSPRSTVLVVAGDVDGASVTESAQRAFGQWRGAKAPQAKYPTAQLAEGLEILLVDRPKSSQAEVLLALFGPSRKGDDYPSLKVANQVLGGGVAGRLFLDVREKRSLAYSTYSSVELVAHGPQPIVLSAGTQTAKAGLAMQALLEHARGMVSSPPTLDETAIHSRYLSDVFLLRMESVGSLASMVSSLAVHELPNDYYDKYREAVASTTAEAATAAARTYFGAGRLLAVVAGDAERLEGPLSHFGEVTVIDPVKGFSEQRKVPHNPEAKLELERIDGT